MKILKLSHFLLLAAIFFIANCKDHELVNPFDLNCPKEIFTPSNLIAEQTGNGIKLNWVQTNTQITGFIISRNENDGTLTEVARVEKSVNLWNDTDVVGGIKYGYHLVAYAGENLSNPLTATLTPAFSATVTTSAASDITFNSAVLGGNVTDEGSSAVTERGICYSTTQNPTITDNKVVIVSGLGDFSTTVSELSENTNYNVRAYAINSYDTAYGTQISFITEAGLPPTVTTLSPTNVTSNNAVLGGDVTNEGSSIVTERGICYSTTQNPTIANNKVENGSGIGVFSATVSELNENTMYYVRAYAINNYDVAYGTQISFTTPILLPPTATTNAANNITPTTATLNGTVNANEQPTTVTFEYGTSTSYGNTAAASQSPVTGNINTVVSADISGLTENTTYHFRIKADYTTGTTYGLDQALTTADNGLVVYYPFNGNAKDESGKGNDGTVSGPILTTDRFGNVNSTYKFNGTGDYIAINKSSIPVPFTVIAWIYKAASKSTQTLLTGSEGYIKIEQWNNTHKVGFTKKLVRDYTFNYILPINEWHCVSWVFDSDAKLYIDGSYIGKINTTISCPMSRISRGYMNGKVDDIRIYNRALSPEEIQSLYHENGWDE